MNYRAIPYTIFGAFYRLWAFTLPIVYLPLFLLITGLLVTLGISIILPASFSHNTQHTLTVLFISSLLFTLFISIPLFQLRTHVSIENPQVNTINWENNTLHNIRSTTDIAISRNPLPIPITQINILVLTSNRLIYFKNADEFTKWIDELITTDQSNCHLCQSQSQKTTKTNHACVTCQRDLIQQGLDQDLGTQKTVAQKF